MVSIAHVDSELIAEGFAFEEESDSDEYGDGDGAGAPLPLPAPLAPGAPAADGAAALVAVHQEDPVFADSELTLLTECFSDYKTGTGYRYRPQAKQQRRNDVLNRKCNRQGERIASLQSQLVEHEEREAQQTRKTGGHPGERRSLDIAFRRACGWTSHRNAAIWVGDPTLHPDTLARARHASDMPSVWLPCV